MYQPSIHQSTQNLIPRRCALLQNLEKKENEQGQYLDINPYMHKLPDSNHLKVFTFASKALSAMECRYVNNESELLAVVTGLKRFHYYYYGRTIHVIADPKSLVNIIQKALAELPARLKRIVHQIYQYDVVLH